VSLSISLDPRHPPLINRKSQIGCRRRERFSKAKIKNGDPQIRAATRFSNISQTLGLLFANLKLTAVSIRHGRCRANIGAFALIVLEKASFEITRNTVVVNSLV
jgi:hypothetical protein